MAARPVIGVIACNRIVGVESAQAVMTRYVAALMRYADAAALIVPALPDLMSAAEVAPRLDAVLLTGSPSNVAPARYGDADPGEGPFDPGRDAMALALAEAMMGRDRPVLGVCRGFQELNVALGGTLRRDLGDGALPHHAPEGTGFDAMFDHRHAVALAPGGTLARLYGERPLTVNSVHYQGIGTLAPGLTVEAAAPDGVIEAFSSSSGRVLAVQWHPEWRTEENPDAQALFAEFGRMARG
jgi:putative glutamine amidotransferase